MIATYVRGQFDISSCLSSRTGTPVEKDQRRDRDTQKVTEKEKGREKEASIE